MGLWVAPAAASPQPATHALTHAHDSAVVCPQMANLVTSLCCVVLAAVVVAYAQRRSQLGEYLSFVSSRKTKHKKRRAELRLTPAPPLCLLPFNLLFLHSPRRVSLHF